ncbi:MAG: replication initiator protein [Wigfec virus K19_160]|nr:MAG: replication initiator protein [Wigfec virus K19_160]
MKCRQPYIRGGMALACGQCMPCRLNARRVWTHRIMLESLLHGDNCMVTLTYTEESLPENGTLVPKHLQDWLKRFRKSIEPLKIRFYGVGEYGDQSERPHYHVILFGYPNCRFGKTRVNRISCCDSCDRVRDTWSHGGVFLCELSTETAQYTAGYVTKKMTKKDDPRLKGRYPEFARMSNGGRNQSGGIGAGMMWDVASALMQFDLEDKQTDVPSALRHGTRLLPLGRYLRRKLRAYVGKDEKTPPAVIEEIKAALRPLQDQAQASSDLTKRKYGDEFRRLLQEAGDGAVARLEAREKIKRKRGSI